MTAFGQHFMAPPCYTDRTPAALHACTAHETPSMKCITERAPHQQKRTSLKTQPMVKFLYSLRRLIAGAEALSTTG